MATGVSRSYAGTPVVAQVDLAVHDGEVLGLIGPNGGGKSTLLLLFAGLVRPDTGTIELDGVPTSTLATRAAGSIGLVTAQPGLYPALTGRENLTWFSGLYGRPLQPLEELAAQLQLTAHLDCPVAALSSGQQQKLSLLRALLLQPKVLLFDEPTANLDPLAAHTLHQAIRERADAGVPVVLCTHDLAAAEQICDRVAVLNRTLRTVHTLPGTRTVPPVGALHALFEAHT